MATLTVNPLTGGSGTSGDGDTNNGYQTTWALWRSNSSLAGAFGMSNANGGVRALNNGSGYYGNRTGLTFDTSALGAGATITSAVLSVFGTTINFINQSSTALTIVGFTPANTGNFVAADWTQFSYTAFASPINFASLNQSGYNDFTLNSSGISNINTTGISSFGMITELDRSNTAPATADNIFNIDMADFGSNKPKLVITYTPAPVTAFLLNLL